MIPLPASFKTWGTVVLVLSIAGAMTFLWARTVHLTSKLDKTEAALKTTGESLERLEKDQAATKKALAGYAKSLKDARQASVDLGKKFDDAKLPTLIVDDPIAAQAFVSSTHSHLECLLQQASGAKLVCDAPAAGADRNQQGDLDSRP